VVERLSCKLLEEV